MPQYLLLLYATESDIPERDESAEFPLWMRFTESLQEAGVLLGGNRLSPSEAATTLRVRNEETEIVDGPFAISKEYLGGYYLLECADLDDALGHAARVPLARYGSVEVRPVADMPSAPSGVEQGAAEAR